MNIQHFDSTCCIGASSLASARSTISASQRWRNASLKRRLRLTTADPWPSQTCLTHSGPLQEEPRPKPVCDLRLLALEERNFRCLLPLHDCRVQDIKEEGPKLRTSMAKATLTEQRIAAFAAHPLRVHGWSVHGLHVNPSLMYLKQLRHKGPQWSRRCSHRHHHWSNLWLRGWRLTGCWEVSQSSASFNRMIAIHPEQTILSDSRLSVGFGRLTVTSCAQCSIRISQRMLPSMRHGWCRYRFGASSVHLRRLGSALLLPRSRPMRYCAQLTH